MLVDSYRVYLQMPNDRIWMPDDQKSIFWVMWSFVVCSQNYMYQCSSKNLEPAKLFTGVWYRNDSVTTPRHASVGSQPQSAPSAGWKSSRFPPESWVLVRVDPSYRVECE